jgi:hypothetical protein
VRPLRRLTLLAAVLLTGTRPARAQDSQFGIRAPGTPGRPESVRARSSGGAFAAFDDASAVADAALGDVKVLTATMVGASYYRSVTLPNSTTDLTSARFPLFTIAGVAKGRVKVGGGYSTYLDDSYEIVTRDSVVLRGETVPFIDASASDGGSSDLRIAAAVNVRPSVTLAVGFHAITGSARVTTTRTFNSPTYATIKDSQVVRQLGFGVSASAMLRPSPSLAIVAFARSDGHFKNKVDSVNVGETDLPNTVGGAVRLILSPGARAAGSVTWRSWSTVGPNSYDTINWSVGMELGSPGNGLRIGGRGGQLPFGPGGSAPTEWAVAAGLGRTVGGGHGGLDLGVERTVRDGGTLHEEVWSVLFGITVRQ